MGKGSTTQSALGSMNQLTIRRYSLSDFKLSLLNANAALHHYTASANFSLGDGSGQDSKLAVGDIWVKRGEHWQSLHYQETETRRLESKGNEYGPDLASHAPHEDTAKAGRDSNFGNLRPGAPISAKFLLELLL